MTHKAIAEHLGTSRAIVTYVIVWVRKHGNVPISRSRASNPSISKVLLAKSKKSLVYVATKTKRLV
jgi:hypothetical protein